jgi:hypothetical protein
MNNGVMFRAVATALLFWAGNALAQSQPAQTPVSASVPAPDDAAASTAASAAIATTATTPTTVPSPETGGDVAELQQLLHDSALTQLRTTYNGSYGASLLLDPADMTYWVALFQHKTFWRVVRTSDARHAELTYQAFVRRTSDLSNVEIRRAQLEAQTAATNRLIADQQDRANRLQADLEVAKKQSQIIAGDQQQGQDAVAALRAEKSAAQAQLHDSERQVQQLRRQLNAGFVRER